MTFEVVGFVFFLRHSHLILLSASDSARERATDWFRCLFQNATSEFVQCYGKLTVTKMVATQNTFRG